MACNISENSKVLGPQVCDTQSIPSLNFLGPHTQQESYDYNPRASELVVQASQGITASCYQAPARHTINPPCLPHPTPHSSYYPHFFSLHFLPFISDQTSDDGNTDKLMIVINKN